jgi:hypothetical protein
MRSSKIFFKRFNLKLLALASYFYWSVLSRPLRAVPGVYSTAINASLSVPSHFVYERQSLAHFYRNSPLLAPNAKGLFS